MSDEPYQVTERGDPRDRVANQLPQRCGCDGSGAISYVERHQGPDRQIGPDLFISPGTTYGTRLCECRKALEARDGRARWWTSETVYSAEMETEILRYGASVSVSAEVPVSEDNYVLKRTGENRHYPTTIDVDIDAPEGGFHFLWPGEARELARMLTEAADAADSIDEASACPDCGCWDAEGNHTEDCRKSAAAGKDSGE